MSPERKVPTPKDVFGFRTWSPVVSGGEKPGVPDEDQEASASALADSSDTEPSTTGTTLAEERARKKREWANGVNHTGGDGPKRGSGGVGSDQALQNAIEREEQGHSQIEEGLRRELHAAKAANAKLVKQNGGLRGENAELDKRVKQLETGEKSSREVMLELQENLRELAKLVGELVKQNEALQGKTDAEQATKPVPAELPISKIDTDRVYSNDEKLNDAIFADYDKTRTDGVAAAYNPALAAQNREYQSKDEADFEQLHALERTYAERTARSRNSYLGHFLEGSKFWARFPGVKRAADWANDRIDRKVIAARTAYEAKVGEIQAGIAAQYLAQVDAADRDKPEIQEAIKVAQRYFLLGSTLELESEIVHDRELVSGGSNKFIDWWTSRPGGKRFGLRRVRHAVAKAGLVFGAGVAVGAGGGLLGVPILGSVLGGAGGLTLANYLTKHRANSVNKDRTLQYFPPSKADLSEQTQAERRRDIVIDDRTLADYQRSNELNRLLRDDTTDVTAMTTTIEAQTAAEKQQNRRRLKSVAGIALSGAGVGVYGTNLLHNALATHSATATHAPQDIHRHIDGRGSEYTPSTAPTLPVAHGAVFQDHGFTIEHGSGFVNELREYLQSSGIHDLSQAQPDQLFNHLHTMFGNNLIVNSAGHPISTYGNALISQPQAGVHWAPGVIKEITNWAAANHLQ